MCRSEERAQHHLQRKLAIQKARGSDTLAPPLKPQFLTPQPRPPPPSLSTPRERCLAANLAQSQLALLAQVRAQKVGTRPREQGGSRIPKEPKSEKSPVAPSSPLAKWLQTTPAPAVPTSLTSPRQPPSSPRTKWEHRDLHAQFAEKHAEAAAAEAADAAAWRREQEHRRRKKRSTDPGGMGLLLESLIRDAGDVMCREQMSHVSPASSQKKPSCKHPRRRWIIGIGPEIMEAADGVAEVLQATPPPFSPVSGACRCNCVHLPGCVTWCCTAQIRARPRAKGLSAVRLLGTGTGLPETAAQGDEEHARTDSRGAASFHRRPPVSISTQIEREPRLQTDLEQRHKVQRSSPQQRPPPQEHSSTPEKPRSPPWLKSRYQSTVKTTQLQSPEMEQGTKYEHFLQQYLQS